MLICFLNHLQKLHIDFNNCNLLFPFAILSKAPALISNTTLSLLILTFDTKSSNEGIGSFINNLLNKFIA